MARRFDLPDSLPLFPLPGALLLPRAVLPLQIFEPRYLQMLEDVLKTDHRLIGMIQPSDDDLAPVGCAGRVIAFSETDDGRYMISLRAVSRFDLIEAEQGFAPYIKGRVDWSDWSPDRGAEETDGAFARGPFLDRLQRFMALQELSTDMDVAGKAEPEMLINSLAMLLPFEPEEKQALLEAKTLAERRELLEGLMEYALHSNGHEERLQ